MCVIVQLPKPMFLLDEIQDGLTNRRFGVLAAVRVDCLHEFVTFVVMFVSILVRLSFSVLCSKSSFVLSNW